MSTLYTKLKDIFLIHPTYNEIHTADEVYPLIKSFLLREIRLGNQYIDPLDFSFKYGLDIKFTNELFLALANQYNIFEKYYSIDCENCSHVTITKELYEITQCVHCGYLNSNESIEGIFNKLRFLYKVTNPIREELVTDLKEQPSSSAKVQGEGKIEYMNNGASKNITFENLDKEKELLDRALSLIVKELM